MKIAAVVVTYNRLTDLKKCIQAIRDQSTPPDGIIIVDNGSEDGTAEWLQEQEDMIVLTQHNTGSAGGQRCGISFAVERGYDWVWCFDDDCIPDRYALEHLRPHMKKNNRAVYNSVPLVDENTFSFGAYGSKTYDDMLKQMVNKVYPVSQAGYFYIGCAIPRHIVLDVGLPITELFIRGEEVEYHHRICERYSVFTIPRSIVYHPREEYYYVKPINKKSFRFPKNLYPMKFYYYVRNNMMLSYRYPKHVLRVPFSFIKNTTLMMYIIIRHYRNKEFIFNYFKGIKDSIFQYRRIFNTNNLKPTLTYHNRQN